MDNYESKCSGQAVALAFVGASGSWGGGRSSVRSEVWGRDAPGFEAIC